MILLRILLAIPCISPIKLIAILSVIPWIAIGQLVRHGHVLVNGKAVNIPVYEIKAGDVIEIKEKSKKLSVVQDALNEISKSGTMPWVSVDVDAVKGTFTSIPRREEISDLADIKEQLIVEYYSK